MASTEEGFQILAARKEDVPLILSFIRKLAKYEKLLDQVAADESSLQQSLFGARPAAEVLLAWHGENVVGFSVFFQNFSTFEGRPGVYIEDVFVEPEYRGRGIGRALFVRIAKIASERGCARLEWAVLDWNVRAVEFYRKMGAVAMDEWTVFRLNGAALNRLAEAAES